MTAPARRVLWWGRFDPGYSRNRILQLAFEELGWSIAAFRPRLSRLGAIEARLRAIAPGDLLFVPCFRQRDIAAAARFARRHATPLLVDPLISAWDKQVYERRKFSATSWRGRRLRTREGLLLRRADAMLADTVEHARFFRDELGVPGERVHVVHVGAEEPLFAPGEELPPNRPLDVLFFGSFIALHGAATIVEAAHRYQGPPVRWTLLGGGPERAALERAARGLPSVVFEDSIPYEELPTRIRQSDILLGIFGATPKAGRVIPNKVYQALACGKPVVTRHAPAYPAELQADPHGGIRWVAPADPDALAAAVAQLAARPESLAELGRAARASYDRFLSCARVVRELAAALAALGFAE